MFESRGKMGPQTITGENAAVLAKRANMVRKYGLDEARSRHDWPALKQAAPKAGGNRYRNRKAETKMLLAELVSEGLSLRKSATLLGTSQPNCSRLWKEIMIEMGDQAV
jgi:hypothetical protein